MSTGTCEKTDCTIATTGTCLLSHANPTKCPHHRPAENQDQAPASTPTGVPPTVEPVSDAIARTFHAGIELGTSDAAELMRSRYTHLIGVLGTTGVGKTTFLTSLYLIASGGLLPTGYIFAASRSLQGFEDRARGLREWADGALHAQLVDHTVLSDPRQPGLLHLAIQEVSDARRTLDLLLTDLPGEWTNSLVQRAANAERLDFLQRADGIILVVDGPVLMSDDRHVEVQRMRNLADRLLGDVAVPTDTPIIVLVSKGDEINMVTPPAAEGLRTYIEQLGFPTKLVLSAAIARPPSTAQNGTGVFEAVRLVIENNPTVQMRQGGPKDRQLGQRTFQGFRHGS